MPYEELCLLRDRLKIDTNNDKKKSGKIGKIYNCRFVPKGGCKLVLAIISMIISIITFKKQSKQHFSCAWFSSRRSCLVNKPKRASTFWERGSFMSLVYFPIVDTALRTSRQVG
jgi:hypothetical protein